MDYKKISDEKAVKTSIRVDIVDILLNSITAFLTGSVVMLAETLQGVSDLIVDGQIGAAGIRSLGTALSLGPLSIVIHQTMEITPMDAVHSKRISDRGRKPNRHLLFTQFIAVFAIADSFFLFLHDVDSLCHVRSILVLLSQVHAIIRLSRFLRSLDLCFRNRVWGSLLQHHVFKNN